MNHQQFPSQAPHQQPPVAPHQPVHAYGPGQVVNAYPVAVIGPPTSGLAVAGFVLSLIGLSPVALVLCVLALKSTGRGEAGGHGLAIAGIVIGGLGTLVWLTVLVQVVASIAFLGSLAVGVAGSTAGA
ncbi:uncharacterized protein DUF4190 [Kineococcus xinjiangensis]|uniref:Uncharacterized protein DUF4190 n=1 Tax=Kineococcus xinjiangensis TaxID=512762 RepID=A0A2S6IK72_9ACTN|nr:DUF4190 domain-containing protein [Kineococcus xinjiangensis]PPK94598.1 uncharacterized protein DUF4190 [Kineococcus xinjiangensis]